MENYNNEDSAILTSKINSASLINFRIDKLLKQCHVFAIAGSYSLWNCVLDTLWSELGCEYKDESEEQKKISSINIKLKSVKNWNNVYTGFNKDTIDRIEMTRQYKILREKELFLRRIMNKQGKGTAYLDEDEDDFE